jgi:Predicted outer membrane protein
MSTAIGAFFCLPVVPHQHCLRIESLDTREDEIMLKTLSFSAAAALAMASVTSAQVVVPRGAPPQQPAPQNAAQQAEQREREQREGRGERGVIIDQNGQRVRVNANADGEARGDHAEKLNGQLADCFLLKNQEEINLARFAMERSQNDKVKAFAQRLIDDHQKYGQSLERFARHSKSENAPANLRDGQPQTTFQRQPGQVQPGTPGTPGQPTPPAQPQILPADPAGRPVVDTPTRPGERIDVRVGYAGTSNSLEDTWYQIEQKAAQNCEQMTKEMLSKEKGADFDRCFIGAQIAAHTALLAQMKAAEPHVSGEFQQVVREGIQAVQQHKQHAEELANELSRDQSSDRSSNRTNERTQQRELQNQR